MTRRAFLAILAGLGAIGTGAVVVATRRSGVPPLMQYLRRLEGFGRTPIARLRSHYAWLDVEPAAFDSYLTDYQHSFGPLDRFSIADPSFFTRFLLSTNFFISAGAHVRDGEPVSYTVFYEPGARACYNPLASRPPSNAELKLG